MIKRILGLLLLSSSAYAFSPFQYVQVTTNTPVQQQGGVSVSSVTATSGTITNLNAPNISTTTISSGTITTLTITTMTIKSGGGIIGTTTNDNANPGNYGEYISSYSNVRINCAPTGQWGDIVSTTIPAGDWNLVGTESMLANGATISRYIICIESLAGNNGANCQDGQTSMDGPIAVDGIREAGASLPDIRVSINTPTTYYLKENASFSAATPQVAGTLTARRIR